MLKSLLAFSGYWSLYSWYTCIHCPSRKKGRMGLRWFLMWAVCAFSGFSLIICSSSHKTILPVSNGHSSSPKQLLCRGYNLGKNWSFTLASLAVPEAHKAFWSTTGDLHFKAMMDTKLWCVRATSEELTSALPGSDYPVWLIPRQFRGLLYSRALQLWWKSHRELWISVGLIFWVKHLWRNSKIVHLTIFPTLHTPYQEVSDTKMKHIQKYIHISWQFTSIVNSDQD